MGRRTDTELAEARAVSASALEAAIADLGSAYAAYREATGAIETRLHAELERALHPAITLHLVKAGFSEFLDRKLTGPAPSLVFVVERQHRRSGVTADAALSD